MNSCDKCNISVAYVGIYVRVFVYSNIFTYLRCSVYVHCRLCTDRFKLIFSGCVIMWQCFNVQRTIFEDVCNNVTTLNELVQCTDWLHISLSSISINRNYMVTLNRLFIHYAKVATEVALYFNFIFYFVFVFLVHAYYFIYWHVVICLQIQWSYVHALSISYTGMLWSACRFNDHMCTRYLRRVIIIAALQMSTIIITIVDNDFDKH